MQDVVGLLLTDEDGNVLRSTIAEVGKPSPGIQQFMSITSYFRMHIMNRLQWRYTYAMIDLSDRKKLPSM